MFAFITVLHTLYCLCVSVQYMYLLFYCLYSGQSLSRSNRPHLCSFTACFWLYFSRLHIYIKYFFLLNGVHFTFWAALLLMKLNVFICSSVFFHPITSCHTVTCAVLHGKCVSRALEINHMYTHTHTHTHTLSLSRQTESLWKHVTVTERVSPCQTFGMKTYLFSVCL